VRIIKLPEVIDRIASKGADFVGNMPEEFTEWGRRGQPSVQPTAARTAARVASS